MTVPVPRGLSGSSVAVWQTLTAQHHFADYELIVFEKSLRWFDRADALAVAADRASSPRDGAALLKSAMDASNTGLRFWRQLKFTDGVARRPGGLSDSDWSAKRKLAVLK